MKIKGKEYQTVRERQFEFYQKFPDGLIYTEILNIEDIAESALVQARVWKVKPDSLDVIPDGIGHAYESSKIPSANQPFSANQSYWVENAETSAIGRALANMGISNGVCSAEEMQRVIEVEQQKQIPEASVPDLSNSTSFVDAYQTILKSQYAKWLDTLQRDEIIDYLGSVVPTETLQKLVQYKGLRNVQSANIELLKAMAIASMIIAETSYSPDFEAQQKKNVEDEDRLRKKAFAQISQLGFGDDLFAILCYKKFNVTS